MRRLALALLGALLLALSSEGAAAQGAPTVCNKAAVYDSAAGGTTQLVAAGTGIQICGFTFFSGGASTGVKLVFGTGTNCGTGTTSVTPNFLLTASTGIADASPYYRGLNAPAGNALCISVGAAVAVQAIVHFNN